MENSGTRPKIATAIAIAMLGLMAALMFASIWDDDFTNDEVPHIGAGYSYLVKKKYHLNPEHPPLMKDLGALPLVFMNLREPWGDKSWTDNPLGEWDFGLLLLFKSGANASTLVRATKAPMILFTIAFGWILFSWTRRKFGDAVAMLSLFFFVFSPTILTHGRLVTTDVGAAAGMFVGVFAFLRALSKPTSKNILLAGLAMGFAFLTKFSTVELIPIALILTGAWVGVETRSEHRGYFRWRRSPGGGVAVRFRFPDRLSDLARAYVRTTAMIAIGFVVVYVVYYFQNFRYSRTEQRNDTTYELDLSQMSGPVRNALLWASDKPVIRPFDEYLLGLAATLKRSTDGNGPYLLGKFRDSGSRLYFPFVYLVKEPLALHLLTLIALGFALFRIRWRSFKREWIADRFTEIAFGFVAVFYWALAIRSNLNIGVRHILPSFPFLFVLVACGVIGLFRHFEQDRSMRWGLSIALSGLLLWQAISVIRVHPSYLPYFNEIVGGPDNGWRYVTDSNVDWGQNLKRLAQFVDQHGIQELYFDYFGASDVGYYLKERYRAINSCSEPVKGWIVISAMWYQESGRNPKCDYRRWLPLDKLVAKIGYSTFIFHLP